MSTTTQLIYNVGAGAMHLSIGGKAACSIYMAPTDNCQMWSIASFQGLLSNHISAEERMIFFKEAHRLSGYKNLLFVDIPTGQVQRAKEMFGKLIRNQMDYDSTNGSKMTILLISTGGGTVSTWYNNLK